ncbi:MAG TPA: signal recognition particle protein [Candidatus Eisenbacteria bacterium]
MFEDLSGKLDDIFRRLRGKGKLTEDNIKETLREVRRALLEADVNYKVAKDFVDQVRDKAIGQDVLKSLTPGQLVVKLVHDQLVELLGGASAPLARAPKPPTVIMVVGLQGSGKTTFCGKLATWFKKKNQRVLMAACDIYRPAAIDQLETVGKQAGVPVYSERGAKPIQIVKGALDAAYKDVSDVLIIDTAGRLHIDDSLMAELGELKSAYKPNEILLVVDGMTGQDAVTISQTFQERLGFDGVVLTKMDGDARGGAALSIRSVTGKPIKFVGTGEKLEALEEFHPDRLASRILGMGDIVSLVERAQEAVDFDEAARLEEKLRREEFTFEDFLTQMQQMKRMGPMEDLLKMLPGVGNKLQGMTFDDKALGKIEAIIRSMTRDERHRPQIIDGSRRRRIALGSGSSVQDVNRLLKEFEGMQKMVKMFGKMGKSGRKMAMPFPPR